MKSVTSRICSLALIALYPVLSLAGTILQPTAATSSLGNAGSQYLPIRAIDQTALSATYTSGVTDFDTFVASTNTVSGGSGNTTWYSSAGVLTGNFDFSLGSLVNIESFALWADPQGAKQGVKAFNLLADDNSAFSSPVVLGSYIAVDGLGNANNFAQVFTFAPTAASFVRMEILSNNGSVSYTGIVEAAFEASAVPVPAAAWFLAPAIGLLVPRMKRRSPA